MEKIEDEIMHSFNSLSRTEIKEFFGSWIENIEMLKHEYKNGNPYEHVIIDNFLSDSFIRSIKGEISKNLEDYYRYNNPVEVKYAMDDLSKMGPNLRKYFYLLSTSFLAGLMSQISNIVLEHDPFLHGAGVHLQPRNGRLGNHLDYEIHPYTGKQRRLNVILYISEDWNPEWNGHTELWSDSPFKKVVSSPPIFNRAVIFKTFDKSWHGVPEKICCPEGTFRETLAYYYVSDRISQENDLIFGNDGSGYRKRAAFILRPEDENKDKLEPFLKIRPFRRIEQSDIDEYWPEWNAEEY